MARLLSPVLMVFPLLTPGPTSSAGLPITLPLHPRLLFTAKDLRHIRQRIATRSWAKAAFEDLRSEAERWRQTEIELPSRGGQWLHHYYCPKHGVRLQTTGPTRHVCPVGGEVLTGYPYDDAVILQKYNRLATAVRTLGITYQLTGDGRYAAKAKGILLGYAARYQNYPLHDIHGHAKVGGGKVAAQSLDEATWLIAVIEGADCVWIPFLQRSGNRCRTGCSHPPPQSSGSTSWESITSSVGRTPPSAWRDCSRAT